MSVFERATRASAVVAGLCVLGCDGADSGGSTPAKAPVQEVGSSSVRVDPNQGGSATRLALAEASWGRLVDLYDHDPATGNETLRYVDLAVGAGVTSLPGELRLEHHAAAGRARLTVLHPAGSAGFEAQLEQVEALEPLAGGALPRDAALVLRFDDLIDPAAIAGAELRAVVEGRAVPARVVADPNHGDWADLDGDGVAEFHTTRVLVDPLVSALDAARGAEPGAQGAGWLAGPVSVSLSNVTSASGAPLAGSHASRSVELAFEAGLAALDTSSPRVLAVQAVDVTSAVSNGGNAYTLAYSFATTRCAVYPERGDVLELAGAWLEVVGGGNVNFDPATGSVSGVRAVRIAGAAVATGPGRHVSPYDPAEGDPPYCFVRFSPEASRPPVKGVSSLADIVVTFSLPMDPASFETLDTFHLQREAPAGPLEEKVPGRVIASVGLHSFRFEPGVPLASAAGAPTAYLFDVVGGANGVTSLGGLPLADDLPPVRFEMDPNQTPVDSSSVSLEFDSVDEDGNGFPEIGGQFIYDLQAGILRPRAVTRFSVTADTDNLSVAAMIPLATGVQTPLSPLGSKMMSVWRYHDLGMPLLDETLHNLDVEGLNWAPATNVLPDDFAEFQMAMSHANYLPDEDLNTGLLPIVPASGLVSTYAANVLDPANHPLQTVHAKSLGYTVDPVNAFISASGRLMMPWPMNQGVPVSQYTRWTWRDTGVLSVGAPGGFGVDTRRMLGLGIPGFANFYKAGEVPTIGLPLLTEFSTWPDVAAGGHNSFQVAIAINTSARPFFRSFSTGGVLSTGQVKLVDPDAEPVATGGVNPFTGTPTAPQDNAFYYGQADFVVRVNRARTIWLDTAGAQSFGAPTLEPTPPHQPAGTQVVLAFRGATAVSSATPGTWERIGLFDAYGDPLTGAQIAKLGGNSNEAFTVTYLNGDASWKSDLGDLDGADLIQARVTMISNPETGLTAPVSGLGIPFVR